MEGNKPMTKLYDNQVEKIKCENCEQHYVVEKDARYTMSNMFKKVCPYCDEGERSISGILEQIQEITNSCKNIMEELVIREAKP
jgi:hypothetical protein